MKAKIKAKDNYKRDNRKLCKNCEYYSERNGMKFCKQCIYQNTFPDQMLK